MCAQYAKVKNTKNNLNWKVFNLHYIAIILFKYLCQGIEYIETHIIKVLFVK